MSKNDLLEFYLKEYNLSDPWDVVDLFEKKVCKYLGSKFAVSVDCCTHAIFLCLKYLNTKEKILIPDTTYISIPNAIKLAGYSVEFEKIEWDGYYYLKPYHIIDSACKFSKNMFIKDTLTCLSFHHRKQIPIGRGGMILTDDKEAYEWFKMARYDGRHLNVKYDNDNFDMIGYHMYMTPEQASIGIQKFENFVDKNLSIGSSETYKSLSKYKKLFE